MNSPRRQLSHTKQCAPCQPTPTRCPTFQGFTPGPTASMRPLISCPGERGYLIPGNNPSLVRTSLWQTPQANTLIRTCPGPGSGISRSTISKAAPGLGTCTTFILAMTRLDLCGGKTHPGIDAEYRWRIENKFLEVRGVDDRRAAWDSIRSDKFQCFG